MGDGAGDNSGKGGKGLEHTVILLRHGESQWNSDNRWKPSTFNPSLNCSYIPWSSLCGQLNYWRPFSTFACAQSQQQITYARKYLMDCSIHLFWTRIFPSLDLILSRFCGWVDVGLSKLGEQEAETAGEALLASGFRWKCNSWKSDPFLHFNHHSLICKLLMTMMMMMITCRHDICQIWCLWQITSLITWYNDQAYHSNHLLANEGSSNTWSCSTEGWTHQHPRDQVSSSSSIHSWWSSQQSPW